MTQKNFCDDDDLWKENIPESHVICEYANYSGMLRIYSMIGSSGQVSDCVGVHVQNVITRRRPSDFALSVHL